MTDAKNEDQLNPKYDLDLDALADEPIAAKGYAAKRKGMSIGELGELSKKDPSELTASQRKEVKEANERMAAALKPILPQLKEAMNFGQQAAKALEGFRMPAVRLPEMPDISRFVAEPPSLTREIVIPNVIPPASSTEQRKQTYLLERMVDVFEAQNAEKDADIMRLIEPRYDRKGRVLTFANVPIRLVTDSDAEIICKKLFRNGRPVKTGAEKGEMIELLYIRAATKTERSKALYNKVASVNRMIEKATGADKLFDFVDKKLWFNTKYVKLPL